MSKSKHSKTPPSSRASHTVGASGPGTLAHMVPGTRPRPGAETTPSASGGTGKTGALSPRQAIAEGQRCLARGDMAGAERLLRQGLQTGTPNAGPHHLEPGHLGTALSGLGVIAARTGHLDAALKLFEQAQKMDPEDPDHGLNRGTALWQQNRRAEALDIFAATAKTHPKIARARHSLASALLETGRFEAARGEAEALLALDPSAADSHALMGRILLRSGNPVAAMAELQEARRLAPKSPAILNDLALALSATGKTAEAIATLQQALALAGSGPRAVEMALNLAGTLITDQRAEEAEALLRPLRDAHPDHVGLNLTLGDALQRQGRFADSRALFQAALDHDPTHVIALRGLAKSGRVSAGDPVIDRLRAAGHDQALSPALRTEALFALGKALDDAGDTAGAFGALTEANGLQASARPFDADSLDDLVAQSRNVFTPDLFESMATVGHPSDRPVFIVGMPRSGTSLVEQIVASHPEAAGAGELGHFSEFQRHLPEHLGAAVPYPECLYGLKGDVLQGFAGHYLKRLAEAAHRVGKPEALRVTDKLPDNAMRLGLIALTFPKARVILCRRDPLDTGLSLFQQNFSGNIPYATSLDNIGRAMVAHDRLMAHWRAVLPIPMLEVTYETLVSNLEEDARRVTDFLGLGWTPAVLRFHETERPVYTASKWQVRQPLFTTSVERWRRYESQLAPLRSILDAAGLLGRPL